MKNPEPPTPFTQYASLIAEALPGWKVEMANEVYSQITLECQEGALKGRLMYLHRVKGRVKVSGLYRHLAGPGVNWSRLPSPPWISVKADRGPLVVACEIQRRFLPEYEVFNKAVNEQIQESQQEEAAVRAAHQRLTGGDGPNHYGKYNSFHLNRLDLQHGYGKGTINSGGETAELHLRSLPIAMAEAVLQVFNTWKRGE